MPDKAVLVAFVPSITQPIKVMVMKVASSCLQLICIAASCMVTCVIPRGHCLVSDSSVSHTYHKEAIKT